MKRTLALFCASSLLTGLLACDGSTPISQERGPVIPEILIDKGHGAMALPLNGDEEAQGDEVSGECLAWVTEEESFDEETGAFVYRYSCAEGGDTAEVVTAGLDNGMGGGSYTTTYRLRDGEAIVWSFTYELDDDGATQYYAGSSSDDETFAAVYTYQQNGDALADEVWNLAEGSYTINGTYFADGRFIGRSVFDDPDTDASPDWTVDHADLEDGGMTQTVAGMFDGWQSDYTYVLNGDGTSSFDFEYDDVETAVDPDIVGAYHYAADGSGAGSYQQVFDDGSTIDVSDLFEADGTVTESWDFDDAATDVEIDQRGSITYAPDRSGSGTITYFDAEGSSETCDVTLGADGSFTEDNCR